MVLALVGRRRLALGRLSRSAVRWPAGAYVEFFRGFRCSS